MTKTSLIKGLEFIANGLDDMGLFVDASVVDDVMFKIAAREGWGVKNFRNLFFDTSKDLTQMDSDKREFVDVDHELLKALDRSSLMMEPMKRLSPMVAEIARKIADVIGGRRDELGLSDEEQDLFDKLRPGLEMNDSEVLRKLKEAEDGGDEIDVPQSQYSAKPSWGWRQSPAMVNASVVDNVMFKIGMFNKEATPITDFMFMIKNLPVWAKEMWPVLREIWMAMAKLKSNLRLAKEASELGIAGMNDLKGMNITRWEQLWDGLIAYQDALRVLNQLRERLSTFLLHENKYIVNYAESLTKGIDEVLKGQIDDVEKILEEVNWHR